MPGVAGEPGSTPAVVAEETRLSSQSGEVAHLVADLMKELGWPRDGRSEGRDRWPRAVRVCSGEGLRRPPQNRTDRVIGVRAPRATADREGRAGVGRLNLGR